MHFQNSMITDFKWLKDEFCTVFWVISIHIPYSSVRFPMIATFETSNISTQENAQSQGWKWNCKCKTSLFFYLFSSIFGCNFREKKCVLNLSSLNKVAGIKRRTRRKVLKDTKDGEQWFQAGEGFCLLTDKQTFAIVESLLWLGESESVNPHIFSDWSSII